LRTLSEDAIMVAGSLAIDFGTLFNGLLYTEQNLRDFKSPNDSGRNVILFWLR